MIKRRIVILSLLIGICLINPKIIKADSPGFGVEYGVSPQAGPGESVDLCAGVLAAGTNTWSGVNYPVTTYYRAKVQMDTYEYDYKTNKFKLVDTILGNDGKLYAGTYKAGNFVGIDYYEEYENDVTVNIVPYCVTRTVTITCQRDIKYPCECVRLRPMSYTKEIKRMNPEDDLSCTCHKTETITPSEGTCPAGYETINTDCNVKSCYAQANTPGNEETAKNILKSYVNNMDNNKEAYASYTAQMNDNNDIKNTTFEKVDPYAYISAGPIEAATNGYGFHQKISLKFKYNPRKTCIDTTTGTVRHINFDKSCDTSKERTIDYSINQEGGIGLYFIPLNAKSGNDVVAYKMAGNKKQTKEMCNKIIDTYKNDGRWKYMLVDINKNPFYMSTSLNEGYARVEHGCYFNTTIYFGVKQEFYNETTTKNLEGYGFYFRPIDINNPFPNGINNGSIWDTVLNTKDNIISVKDSNNNTKVIDLNDSYKTLTYKAEYNTSANSISAIKDYNKTNPYTSWKNMNANGSSDFINNNYVTRIGNQSFYKLGCGPANANWKECQ